MKIKTLLKVIGFACILLQILACEQVIQVDLKEAEPTLVVEALVTDSLAPFRVKLTTTKPYFSSDRAPVVATAFVTIADNSGNTDTLKYNGNGIYLTAQAKKGIPNLTYTLLIKYNNKQYSAAAVLNQHYQIDSITYKFVKGTPLPPGYYMTLYAGALQKPGHFFQIRILRNDTPQIFPFKYFTDGDQFIVIGKPIVAQIPYVLRQHDKVDFEYYAITKEYYQYLFNLNNQLNSSGGPFDAQPANLPTNINGGAFGYFVVAGINKRSFVIN
jgi:hypothetical protein